MSDSEEIEFAKRMNVDEETRERYQDLVESMAYPILLRMLKNNLIDLEKANDRTYLWGVVSENITPGLEVFILLHKDFLEVAQYCIENNKQHTAIVLVATSIEHVTNMFYRSLLAYKGLSDAKITKFINGTSINAKLRQQLKDESNATLSDELLNHIGKIIDLRNDIVHYKAIPEKLDVESGSWENIKPGIDNIDYEKLLDIPDELEDSLMEILEQIDLSRKIARELWHTMFNK